MPSPHCPLLIFADDWGRHPSSAQHLARRLLDRHAIYWVNTIGTRKPRLDLGTLRRGWEKAAHWLHRSEARAVLPENLHVVNPWMWPWFSAGRDRRLNRALLRRQLTPLLESLPEPAVAVTTLPITADLVGVLPVARWVYYCVDDFAVWPGLDGAALRTMEEQLACRVDELVAVSENLRERLAGLGRASGLLTHGVDLDFWRADGVEHSLPELEGLPRPLIVFWGVIDRRMDVGWVERLTAELPTGTVVLVGPHDRPDPALGRLPRVVSRPPLLFEHLPWLAREASVLVMPYADLPVTRAMQPLKLKEYLATGRPVVVRDLPATRPWGDCLDLARTADEFAHAVRRRLATGLPEEHRQARGRLIHEGWDAKARELESYLVDDDLGANAKSQAGNGIHA